MVRSVGEAKRLWDDHRNERSDNEAPRLEKKGKVVNDGGQSWRGAGQEDR